jgi:polar amino acid transport system permease protein
MLREFTINEFSSLVLAARWTLALTSIAFLGGGLLGLIFMVLRVLPFRPAN